MKKILCLDFDGVIHGYQSGWQGADQIPDLPVPGAMRFIDHVVADYRVAIYSSRSHQAGGIEAMKSWLRRNLGDFYLQRDGVDRAYKECRPAAVMDMIEWPTEKPPAFLTIDDRALTFTGVWPSMEEIENFQPWNKR